MWIDALFAMAAIGIITVGIFRFGLLATTVMMFTDNLPGAVPFTGRLFHWSATPIVATTLLVLTLVLIG